jgi:hypothetical protein
MAHQYVCVSYAGSKILDADLPGSRSWKVILDEFEDVRAALGGDDNANISRSRHKCSLFSREDI